jgi:hypothetical protein
MGKAKANGIFAKLKKLKELKKRRKKRFILITNCTYRIIADVRKYNEK